MKKTSKYRVPEIYLPQNVCSRYACYMSQRIKKKQLIYHWFWWPKSKHTVKRELNKLVCDKG